MVIPYLKYLIQVKIWLKYIKEIKGKEIVGFGAYIPELIPKELEEYFDVYNSKIKKLDVHLRGIAPNHNSIKSYRDQDKNFGREIKIIPLEKYSSETSIEVTDNMVRIIDMKNLQGIVIDNPVIAKTMKEIFEMVWEKTDLV